MTVNRPDRYGMSRCGGTLRLPGFGCISPFPSVLLVYLPLDCTNDTVRIAAGNHEYVSLLVTDVTDRNQNTLPIPCTRSRYLF